MNADSNREREREGDVHLTVVATCRLDDMRQEFAYLFPKYMGTDVSICLLTLIGA